jgi:hypothetical protein
MAKTRKPRRAAPRPRRAASRKARGESARLPRVSKSEAPFVFRGTVLHRGVATFADVPVNKDTVVVRVDQILQAPDILHDFAGQPITVQLAAKQKVAEGDEHVFHTHGWIYGAGLAVVADDLSSASVASRVNAALQSRVTQSLRSRASQAELVVSGEVKEVRQAARPAHAPISEHDPEWQEAVVRVGHVAKGARSKSTREVVVRFAASRDVKWARAPKFNVGQQGVWMLGHKAKKEAAAMRLFAAAPKTQYVVVDPEDFHPQDQAARVLSQIE